MYAIKMRAVTDRPLLNYAAGKVSHDVVHLFFAAGIVGLEVEKLYRYHLQAHLKTAYLQEKQHTQTISKHAKKISLSFFSTPLFLFAD